MQAISFNADGTVFTLGRSNQDDDEHLTAFINGILPENGFLIYIDDTEFRYNLFNCYAVMPDKTLTFRPETSISINDSKIVNGIAFKTAMLYSQNVDGSMTQGQQIQDGFDLSTISNTSGYIEAWPEQRVVFNYLS